MTIHFQGAADFVVIGNGDADAQFAGARGDLGDAVKSVGIGRVESAGPLRYISD
jgi:hypothetical protein